MHSSGEMSSSFASLSDQATVRELVSLTRTASFRYLVIKRADGGYAAWPLQGEKAIQKILGCAANNIGPKILEFQLSDVPGLTEPCKPVESNDPWSWALRWTCQQHSPAKCTVVLEDGTLQGVLGTAFRGDHLIFYSCRN